MKQACNPAWPSGLWSNWILRGRTQRLKKGELILPKGGTLERMLTGCGCSSALLPILTEACFFSIYFHSLSCPHVFPVLSIGLGWPGLISIACKHRALTSNCWLEQNFVFINVCPNGTVTLVAEKKSDLGTPFSKLSVVVLLSCLLCCSV